MLITTEFLGNRIRQARLDSDLTQSDLANYLNRTKSSISQLEKGQIQISATDLQKIAHHLNKPIEYFFGGDKYENFINEIIAISRNADPKTIEEQSIF